MKTKKLIDLIFRLKAGCVANEMKIMSESGLSPAEYNGIAALDPKDRISGNDISMKMNLSPSRASRVVDKMVQKGYLNREIDPADRRRCTIFLSNQGISLKQEIDRLKRKCEARIRDKLSQSEAEALRGTLEKVIDVI